MRLTLFCLIAVISLFACKNALVELIRGVDFVNYSEEEYAAISSVLDLPRQFDNYATADGFRSGASQGTLGRVLFYDKSLSKDRTVSCASCHHQENAFGDPNALSEGIYGRLTERNSIALGSFASFDSEYGIGGGGSLTVPHGPKPLFWDLRAESVNEQMIETIANANEMGMSLDEVVYRLQGKEHYEILFRKAYGNSVVTEGRILKALETFMRAMRSDDSDFDKALGAQFADAQSLVTHELQLLSQSENRGLNLFIANCSSCHIASLSPKVHVPFSNDLLAANNGLDAESADPGVGGITGQPDHLGAFKIPSLRNVELTYPYMHDGRFATLEEVIDFYSDGIKQGPYLDARLRNADGSPRHMHFDDQEKEDLIAFLGTLTDMSELSHSKFSDPWQ